MGVGPLLSAAGVLMLARLDESVGYFADLLPAIVVFGTGLALTVAPLTATVMAEAHREDLLREAVQHRLVMQARSARSHRAPAQWQAAVARVNEWVS